VLASMSRAGMIGTAETNSVTTTALPSRYTRARVNWGPH
jgi:hypothetical protein